MPALNQELLKLKAEKNNMHPKTDRTKINQNIRQIQDSIRNFEVKLEADKDREEPAELRKINNNQNTKKIPDDTQIKKDPIIVQEQFQNQNPMLYNSILKKEYNSEFELESNYNPNRNEAQYRYSIDQIKMENKKITSLKKDIQTLEMQRKNMSNAPIDYKSKNLKILDDNIQNLKSELYQILSVHNVIIEE